MKLIIPIKPVPKVLIKSLPPVAVEAPKNPLKIYIKVKK